MNLICQFNYEAGALEGFGLDSVSPEIRSPSLTPMMQKRQRRGGKGKRKAAKEGDLASAEGGIMSKGWNSAAAWPLLLCKAHYTEKASNMAALQIRTPEKQRVIEAGRWYSCAGCWISNSFQKVFLQLLLLCVLLCDVKVGCSKTRGGALKEAKREWSAGFNCMEQTNNNTAEVPRRWKVNEMKQDQTKLHAIGKLLNWDFTLMLL